MTKFFSALLLYLSHTPAVLITHSSCTHHTLLLYPLHTPAIPITHSCCTHHTLLLHPSHTPAAPMKHSCCTHRTRLHTDHCAPVHRPAELSATRHCPQPSARAVTLKTLPLPRREQLTERHQRHLRVAFTDATGRDSGSGFGHGTEASSSMALDMVQMPVAP